jgi:hypothetical protein
MEVLQKLGIALGFATLAGIDLYLTVFATSLALYNGWIVLSPEYHDLAILGHPAVLIISGLLYFIEFFADKVPWLDSAWDALHTAIRPIGGAFLAIETLGRPDPVFDVIIGLLAGGVALTTHGAKAGTRLLVNGSPEPFSNIAVSVGEDIGVGAGLGLMAYSYKHSPYLALIVFSVFIVTLWYVTPKIFRFARIKIWLLWKKLSSPPAEAQAAVPGRELPADEDISFHRLNPEGGRIAWTARCLTGSATKGGLPASFSGYLVALEGETAKLHFVGRRGWRSLAKTLELAGWKVSHESRFLSEDLTLYHPAREARQVFVFDRSKAPLVDSVTALVRDRLAGEPALAGDAPATVTSRSEDAAVGESVGRLQEV